MSQHIIIESLDNRSTTLATNIPFNKHKQATRLQKCIVLYIYEFKVPQRHLSDVPSPSRLYRTLLTFAALSRSFEIIRFSS